MLSTRSSNEVEGLLRSHSCPQSVITYLKDNSMLSIADIASAAPDPAHADALCRRAGLDPDEDKNFPVLVRVRSIAQFCVAKAKRAVEGGDADEAVRLDEPIPARVRADLITEYANHYGSTPATARIPSDRILGRLWRERDRRAPTFMELAHVRSLANPASTMQEIRVEAGKATVIETDEQGAGAEQCSTFLRALRTLLTGYALVGCEQMETEEGCGTMAPYCAQEVLEDYFDLVLTAAAGGGASGKPMPMADMIAADRRTRQKWLDVMRRRKFSLGYAITYCEAAVDAIWGSFRSSGKDERPSAGKGANGDAKQLEKARKRTADLQRELEQARKKLRSGQGGSQQRDGPHKRGGGGKGGKGGKGVCKLFQSGKCTFDPCRFDHACAKCGGSGHGDTTCPER